MPKQTLAPTPLVGWVYDLVLAILSPLIDMFFREVSVRGAWKLPKDGPVILVAAPHANQVRQTPPTMSFRFKSVC
jgi:glycerol-3-phosphate O-acyltransferase/dihydroxyacetone phosphate acyltransferase